VFTPEEFPVGCNIGIGLEGLVDIDCDSRLTAIGARHILPATAARFGHHGVITHYMYRVANPPPFKDFGNVEFRTGHNRQTMVPGSKWYPKDGEFRDPENLRWAGQNGALPPPPEMAEVDGDKLYHLTQTLSALARMAECAGPGSFHRVNNAMAAYCVYRGIEVEVAVATTH
jgi:hypothetical protein